MLGDNAAQPTPDDGRVPADAHGAWRIELRYRPIAHRGHAFLTLVDPEGTPRAELHGLAVSKHTGKVVPLGSDDAQLQAFTDRAMPTEETRKITDVAAGTYDDIVRGKWARGQRVADAISKRKLDYKGDDLSYEIAGGSGGQIQNSNSAAYTFGKGMNLDLDGAIQDAGIERKFPGWGRNLLDPAYKPYVAPAMFPTDNRP
jgi:hypothetical protein